MHEPYSLAAHASLIADEVQLCRDELLHQGIPVDIDDLNYLRVHLCLLTLAAQALEANDDSA